MATVEPLPDTMDRPLLKVLVVDDDETMRDFLSIGLKKLGLEVVTASDGMAPLNLCSEHRFDLGNLCLSPFRRFDFAK